MGDDVQSIEDLIMASRGDTVGDDQSAQAKFQAKQKEIKAKETERSTQTKARDMGVPYINLFGFPVSPEALVLIPEERARQLNVVCFFYDGRNVRLGATHPEVPEIKAIAAGLREKQHSLVEIYLISSNSLFYAFRQYRSIPKIRKTSRGVDLTEADLNMFSEKFSSFKDLQAEIDKAKITDIVAMIMAASVKTNSSDIHIEAEEKSIKIRFRIDGVLHDAAEINKELWKKIISRMKSLARVKINVDDKPQDGRMSIDMKDDRIDIRVSFLPTNYGESVVMRLLRSSTAGLAFEQLGIRGHAYEQLKKEVERPNGMIITTGPTGSGKTTTLYAILKKLNNQETKIITIEDPIEYQLEGVNQSQTSEKYTFSQGLRSIVRQDPDVVMVGEIRDLETAEISIQAALTGHLVLSTIHTNDAAGTVPRFISMGAKPFLLAPALNAIIGQRLVRRVCDKCKVEAKIEPERMARATSILESLTADQRKKVDFNNLRFFKGNGCEACQGIGYKGRIGVYEIMVLNEELEKLILSGKASEYDMRNAGVRAGMITMVQDGVIKALEGITTIDEIFRVSEEK
ncbi:type II/IV secretion system protein [Candidatus Parcubacteria bacterium]|nr:type II/IV secretion system protein [Candidatus Parcubacteria bacterium]